MTQRNENSTTACRDDLLHRSVTETEAKRRHGEHGFFAQQPIHHCCSQRLIVDSRHTTRPIATLVTNMRRKSANHPLTRIFIALALVAGVSPAFAQDTNQAAGQTNPPAE